MSARIDKIKDNYSEQFKDKLTQEKVDISLNSAWDIMISADPSPNKKNVRWLVETYINNGYLWEDITGGPTSKVAETLTEFDKHKRNLETSQRSLMKYTTLGSLWAAIRSYVGQLTPGEEKREEREKAYAEAEVIVDREDGFKIVVPFTELSAKWFGKGTRWCTSADNDNMFKCYFDRAPLLIILMPNGDKLQLWKNDRSVQFMDENDENISIEYIEQHWEYLKIIINYIDKIEYYPEKMLNYNFYFSSIKTSKQNIESIPKRYIDYNLCLEAVKHGEVCLKDIPDNCIDYNMCLEAVKSNGIDLLHVPDKYKDYNMCLEAVKRDGSIFEYIPEKYRNYDICLVSVKNNGGNLKYISDNCIDYNICLIAIQNNLAFTDIPNKYLDYNLCLEAIKSNASNLKYIPKRYIDYNLCLEAVKQNGMTFQDIPEEYKDYNMYLEAVKSNGNVLLYIPDKHKDYDIYMKAVQKNNEIFEYLPVQYKLKNIDKLPKKYKIIADMKELFQAPEPSLKM